MIIAQAQMQAETMELQIGASLFAEADAKLTRIKEQIETLRRLAGENADTVSLRRVQQQICDDFAASAKPFFRFTSMAGFTIETDSEGEQIKTTFRHMIVPDKVESVPTDDTFDTMLAELDRSHRRLAIFARRIRAAIELLGFFSPNETIQAPTRQGSCLASGVISPSMGKIIERFTAR